MGDYNKNGKPKVQEGIGMQGCLSALLLGCWSTASVSLGEGRTKSKIGGSNSVFLQVSNSGSWMDAVILNPLCIQMLLGTIGSEK